MSYYIIEKGLIEQPPYTPEVGQDVEEYKSGGIRTPGFVLSEMRSVNRGVESLAKDISASPVAPASYKAEFAIWQNEWSQFYDEHDDGVGAWFARGTTPVYNKTIEFKAMLDRWRNRLEDYGGTVTTPAIPKQSKVKRWGKYVPLLLIGGGALGLWAYLRKRKVVTFKRT